MQATGPIDCSEPKSDEAVRHIGRGYRFERLTLPVMMGDMRFSQGDPRPGDRVPNFDLPLVGGGCFRACELATTGPALVVFGSNTCPMTDSAAPGLNELHRRFGDRIRVVMVNVREAHPGQTLPQPESSTAKMARAEQLRDLHGFAFDVAVDDPNGTLHRALSPKPNSAYIVGTDGAILFRAHWANDRVALAAAVESVVSGKRPRHAESGRMLGPMARMLRHIAPALDRAGAGAWADMWRVAPPLAAIATALKMIGVRPPARTTGRAPSTASRA